MTHKQRTLLVGLGVVIIAMILFPPFQYRTQAATLNLGYSFLFSPPEPLPVQRPTEHGSVDTGEEVNFIDAAIARASQPTVYGSVNTQLLLLQLFGVGVAGSMFWFALGHGK